MVDQVKQARPVWQLDHCEPLINDVMNAGHNNKTSEQASTAFALLKTIERNDKAAICKKAVKLEVVNPLDNGNIKHETQLNAIAQNDDVAIQDSLKTLQSEVVEEWNAVQESDADLEAGQTAEAMHRYSRLEAAMDILGQKLQDAMDSGNYRVASSLATSIFALFKGMESVDKAKLKSKLTDMLKETSDENVATHNVKWKLVAGIISGTIQITAGLTGVVGGIAGPVLSGLGGALGTAGAALKGAAGAAQTFSYAGNGMDSIANAAFSPTEGRRVGLGSLEQAQRSERDDLKSGEDSAKQAKSQAWEQEKERRKAEENAKSAITRS